MGKNKATRRDRTKSVNHAQAALMLKRGASYAAVQAATGITKKDITALKRGEITPDFGMVQDLEAHEHDKMTLAISQLSVALTDEEKLERARLGEVASALTAAVHVRQLVAGRPTSINEHRTMSVRDLLKLREEMAEKAGLRNVTPPSPAD